MCAIHCYFFHRSTNVWIHSYIYFIISHSLQPQMQLFFLFVCLNKSFCNVTERVSVRGLSVQIHDKNETANQVEPHNAYYETERSHWISGIQHQLKSGTNWTCVLNTIVEALMNNVKVKQKQRSDKKQTKLSNVGFIASFSDSLSFLFPNCWRWTQFYENHRLWYVFIKIKINLFAVS